MTRLVLPSLPGPPDLSQAAGRASTLVDQQCVRSPLFAAALVLIGRNKTPETKLGGAPDALSDWNAGTRETALPPICVCPRIKRGHSSAERTCAHWAHYCC
mmetsp:Transcript_27623/g.50621  ORF Transcript_27623/g.50621 Transcript_27623/m.50621 type:complete len:101 (+) Transcript_27623:147-449(+)